MTNARDGTGPVIGAAGGAASFATLDFGNRSPAGCAHSSRAHSAGRAAGCPDATRPDSASLLPSVGQYGRVVLGVLQGLAEEAG